MHAHVFYIVITLIVVAIIALLIAIGKRMQRDEKQADRRQIAFNDISNAVAQLYNAAHGGPQMGSAAADQIIAMIDDSMEEFGIGLLEVNQSPVMKMAGMILTKDTLDDWRSKILSRECERNQRTSAVQGRRNADKARVAA